MILIRYENILDTVKKRNLPMRIIMLIIGCFIVALIYNSFIVPNKIVYAGIGGLAIVVQNVFGIERTLFINVVTVLLILFSFITIGFKKTSHTIVGYLMYILMINLTNPLSVYINFKFDSFLFTILFYATIAGLGSGLIYKAGFNTGGTDSIIYVLQKYFKFPTAKLSNIVNGIIILLGASTFGFTMSVYAIIYLKVYNFFSNSVIVGLSDSKICFIKSTYLNSIEKYLTETLSIGYTIINKTHIFKNTNQPIIFCVIPTNRFYDFKRNLLNIDKNVSLIANDCYTVEGGRTNKIIKV